MFNEGFQSVTNNDGINRNVEVEIMRHERDFDPDSTDIKFEKIDSDSPEGILLINTYDRLLSGCYEDVKKGKDGSSFVGSGNHAIVLRDPEKNFCMKVSWDMLLLNHKFRSNNRTFDLPDRLQGLHKINTYFNGSPTIEGIKQKRRRLINANIEFKTPNSIKVEAAITEYVYDQFSKIGIKGVTPKVLSVFRYTNEEEGKTEYIEDYAVSEKIQAIHLGYIDGITVEQLILDHPEEFLGHIDIEVFITELRRLIDLVHSFKVTHGDLSIRNVMIDRQTLMPRIIDFGAAQFSKNGLNQDELKHDADGVENISNLLRHFQNDPQRAEEALRDRHSKL